MRGHCDTMRTFRDSSRRFCESIRKPIANSTHPSEIGALHESDPGFQIMFLFQRFICVKPNFHSCFKANQCFRNGDIGRKHMQVHTILEFLSFCYSSPEPKAHKVSFVGTHTAPIGALCVPCLRIQLRQELCAYPTCAYNVCVCIVKSY